MSDRTVSLRDAGRGREGTDPGRDIHVRLPFPSDRARLWIPKRGKPPEPPTADGPYELVFRTDVLQRMSRHATGEASSSRFGFLLGRLHRCPDSGIHYAVADRVIPAGEEFAEEAPGAYLLRAWADAQPEFRRHPGVLLGWYHSHRLLGLLLSEGDEDANRRYFHDPWQCCVLFVPDDVRPLGSVFRPGLVSKSGGQPDPAAFWELPDEDSSPSRRPTLDWTNYRLESPAATPEASGSRPDPADEPPATGPPTDAGRSPVGVVIPPASSDATPVSPRHRKSSWTTVFAFVALLALITTVVMLGMQRNEPPQVARPSVQRPVRPSVSPERARFDELSAQLRTAIDRYGERAGDFDLGRIGCDLLTTGYGVVDESFIRLVAMQARLDADLAADVAQEYDRISEEVDDVNGHFDASGCPRPE